jgi:DNA-binding transcriptional LysR family regulator
MWCSLGGLNIIWVVAIAFSFGQAMLQRSPRMPAGAHMEEVLGGVLFERKQSGLRLTPFGQRVATAAARVESEILALESALHAEQRVLSGKIRFTCSEAMANIVVMPCLREFRSRYPDIMVDLIADDHFLDFAVGEADVALREARGRKAPASLRGVCKTRPGVLIAARPTPSSTGIPKRLRRSTGIWSWAWKDRWAICLFRYGLRA